MQRILTLCYRSFICELFLAVTLFEDILLSDIHLDYIKRAMRKLILAACFSLQVEESAFLDASQASFTELNRSLSAGRLS